MKKSILCALFVLLLCNAAIFNCSQKEEAESEKGAIEKITDQAADELTNRIRTPLEKARSAANQQEDRMQAVDDKLKEE